MLSCIFFCPVPGFLKLAGPAWSCEISSPRKIMVHSQHRESFSLEAWQQRYIYFLSIF